MDWDKLRVFHAVAKAGSFTHAAEMLNLSQSAVSRQISNLEGNLKCVLFHRHARGLILTEQGELLYNTTTEVFAKLAMAEAKLADAKGQAEGKLRITASQSFGTLWLTPTLAEFAETYPNIDIEVILENKELDLSMREADVAIRMTPPRQPELIQRHLLSMYLKIYASQEYVRRFGIPLSAEELDNHRIIGYGDEGRLGFSNSNWLLKIGRSLEWPRRPVITINSLYAILKAVEVGIGIAAMPAYMVDVSPKLVEILPELSGPKLDAYFVYPEELKQSKRIEVFRDFLLKKVSQSAFVG